MAKDVGRFHSVLVSCDEHICCVLFPLFVMKRRENISALFMTPFFFHIQHTICRYLRGTGGLHMHYVREVSTSDQRVTTDIITMTKAMGDFVYLIAFSPFMSVYLLFVITIMFGWLTPVVLTVQLIICFAVNKFVVGLLTPKVYFAEQAEGAFRGSVAQACMYAEPIGFCTPKAKWVGEKTRIERLFAKALEAQWAVLYKRVLLSATSIMSSQFGTFTSYVALMVALLYFQKEELDDETITERYSSGLYYCSYLIGEITQLVGAFEALSRVHGSAGRVAELLNATEFLEARRDLPHWYQRIYWFKSIFDLKQEITKTNKDIISEPDDALRWPIPKYVIKNDTLLTVRNLDLECRGRTLLRDFNFSITRGRNVLVSGPSGCGKTSLLRALAGISPISRGDVVWNISLLHSQAIFAPQDPFCFAGTMKENVTYPHVGDTLFDEFSPEMISWNEAAHNALAAVGLYFVLDPTKGLETVADWPSILSKGEVQRLSIGRIFMFRPILAILDEATSGLQESLTATIYARLDAMGITIITVGHRESLAVHHDVRITMGVDDLGSYKIDELDHEWTKSVLRSDIKKGLSCL